ncbi:MAG TPA: hypothetical protein VEJ37_09575 [Xanthobacteraceae bacterium]|nr:hypothetical protein [Xanthobacteraceae bacterium]
MIVLIDEQSDVVLARIESAVGTVLVLAEVELVERVLTLRGMHIQGEGVGANELSVIGIRRIVRDAMEELDVDEIVIEGAVRTTGASPGRSPRRLRFARKIPFKG